jgi:hypothetical protein
MSVEWSVVGDGCISETAVVPKLRVDNQRESGVQPKSKRRGGVDCGNNDEQVVVVSHSERCGKQQNQWPVNGSEWREGE